ncbi:Phosphatidylethanolamine-binding, conserved site,Phosphatidylethanolamine-binding protein [Cinara cedri]|uniref:Phosphatidylethanolamine-binding, conserved site,Phosphatidylethanolamine-binding protein n=1 Tax=Cinara cedri TaxID=506608 RepID=A0A5E4MV21_9HEMI|nr:Phosphatidylethanolamine-binding, conserved site,Phosphatidylethanolamine-binding protein [Cinara cedri]
MWKLTTLCLMCVCVALSDAYWFCSTSNHVVRAMENEGIEKVVANALPSIKLSVKYPESGFEVDLGNELKPKDLNNIPEVHWDEANEKKNYTLIFTDPDVPSRTNPINKEFLHWLVVNIPGNRVKDGKVIADYVGPAPPKGTGLHRYVFLVFEQEDGMYNFPKFNFIDNRTAVGRPLFSTNLFLMDNNLIIIPLAGNFFKAQYDDSVPVTHKQIGLQP